MVKQININHLRINDERIKQYIDTETAKAGKHEIVNSAGTALPTEPNIRFNGLDAIDNAQDATSEISAKGLNADDLAEIVSTTPANYAVGNTAMYSTTEQIVGRWIDGQPLYQRTWVKTTSPQQALAVNTWTAMALDGVPSGAVLRDGTMVNENGAILPVAFGLTATGINYFSHAAYGWTRLNITIKYTKASS